MPIIGITVSRMLMGFIDFAMVSRLGTEAQAAISPASVIVFSVLCLGMGATSTVQTFAAQAMGRGEPREGSAYAWHGVYIAVGFGLLIWPITRAVPGFYQWVGGMADHEAGILALEIDYTRIALWSFTPAVMSVALNGFFLGIQRPRISLISILISIVFNIVANYALIFGHFGFPAMGIRGAAYGTVLAWWVRALVLLAAFCSPLFAEQYKTLRAMMPSRKRMAGIARIGVPASIQWLVDMSAWAVFMVLIIPEFGKTAMAASNIGIQFMHLSFMPAIGLGMALTSQVGFAIGEGDPEKAIARTQLGMKMAMIYMGSIGLIFLVARHPLIGLLTDDPAVIAAGGQVLIWAAIFQVFDALAIIYTNALRGAGDTRWPAVVVFFSCWGIFIGGGYAIAIGLPQWGINGPWMMCSLYIITVGLLLWWRFRGGAWQKIRLFDAEEESPRTAAGAVSEPSNP